MTVVGVVSDVRQFALDVPSRPELYVPYAQIAWQVGSLYYVVRATDGNAAALAPTVRGVVRTLDADIVVSGMEPLSDVVGRSAETTRFMTLLLLWFGLAALLLGAIGVYGVTAVGVARRLPEFGVRVALGATRRDVLRSALGRGIVPIAAGIVLGTLCALAATRLLRTLLFEVSPTDPATFATVAGLLAAVGLAALLSPAWRAARTDPATVLRQE
jgi:putative ABC transport system permease protein